MKKYIFLFAAFFMSKNAFSQVKGMVTLANQTVSGGNFQFDIYLKTVTGTSGDLFLGTADFVLNFNAANFSSPVITKVGASPGFCTFVPTDPSGLNTQFTQDGYFTRTSPAPVVSSMIVNLSDPAPGDQSVFDTRIAKINSSILTHRLGRFQVSGFTGTTVADANLQWKTTGTGVLTAIYTLANASPFTSTAVELSTEIALPLELVDFQVRANQRAIDLFWETKTETDFDGFEIQRSENNGQNFEKIGFQKGKGGFETANYGFADLDVRPGVDYFYRLKMIDLDGQFSFSKIKTARIGDGQKGAKIYPSPASEKLTVEFGDLQPERLEVFDISGKLMISTVDFEKTGGEIDISALPNGPYFLRFISKTSGKAPVDFRFLKADF